MKQKSSVSTSLSRCGVSLLETMVDSFFLLSQNLVLVYPYLLFLLTVSLITSQVSLGVNSDVALMGVVGILALLGLAFGAGWFAMMAEAVNQQEALMIQEVPPSTAEEPERQMPSVADSWRLFSAFLPGVGQFFLPLLLGCLPYLVVFFLVFFFLPEWMYGNQPTQFTVQIFQGQIFQYFLLGVLGLWIFQLLSLLWIPAVVQLGKGTVQAYIISVKQVLRDPLRLVTYFVFYTAALFLFAMAWLACFVFHIELALILIQFLHLLFVVYGFLFLFLYTQRHIPVPALKNTDAVTSQTEANTDTAV